MAILINFFDNVILQAISEEIVPKVSFFKDRYFPTGAGDIFKANEVLTEYRSGDRKLAAFVDQKAGDIPIGRRSYEVHSYKPAYIAPSRLLTLDELTKRGFGEALYPGMDEAQRAARLLADDMNDMENRIARREEWMAAETMIGNGCVMQEYIDGATKGDVAEQGTSIVAPVTATAGLQVVIGTAPINRASDPYHCTNTPMLANTLAGATAAVGYDDDYEKYTVCQSMGASFKVVGVSPMILINVLDPNKHKKNLPEKTVQVNDGVAVVEEKDILLDKLTVKAEETPLAAGTDYTAAFDDNGYVNIVVIPGGAGDSATSLTVSGVQIDPTAVTPADIVGAVTADGVESGMEVIRQIFPKLNMTPGILLAPGWSENALVSAGLQAKTSHINGVFNCVCIVDIDSSTAGATKYDDVKRQKEKQAVTSANCYAVWLYAKVGDVIYAGSAMAAAATVATDANNGDIPNVSPDNKPISISAACLKDGTEVLLDQEQANVVNSFGVATWLNMNGFRLWGNNTACYPGNTDPKDRWFSVRRFFCWDDNTFIQTYFQKVSDPLNKRLIEALVDSENVRGNSFVSRGICARYELQYIESENPTTDLLNGTVKFHKYMSPFNPAEDIEEIVEFDPNAISTALAG